MKEKTITNRGPKRRDETCFQVRRDIIIPAGVILRQDPGKAGTFTCPVGRGKFTLERLDAEASDTFKRVIA